MKAASTNWCLPSPKGLVAHEETSHSLHKSLAFGEGGVEEDGGVRVDEADPLELFFAHESVLGERVDAVAVDAVVEVGKEACCCSC